MYIIIKDNEIIAATEFEELAQGDQWQKTDREVIRAWDGRLYFAGEEPPEPEPITPPEPTPAELAQQQINELEASITARNIRAALTGDEYALNKIQNIENQIAELRKQL